jgi:hypothetical protein
MQTLLLQWSPSVHASPSLQFAASLATCLQPVALSQLSVVHGLLSSQFFVVPVQAPVAHLSVSVHAS